MYFFSICEQIQLRIHRHRQTNLCMKAWLDEQGFWMNSFPLKESSIAWPWNAS